MPYGTPGHNECCLASQGLTVDEHVRTNGGRQLHLNVRHRDALRALVEVSPYRDVCLGVLVPLPPPPVRHAISVADDRTLAAVNGTGWTGDASGRTNLAAAIQGVVVHPAEPFRNHRSWTTFNTAFLQMRLLQ